MVRRKSVWLALGMVAILSLVGLANVDWITPYVVGDTAAWFFDNPVGVAVTGLHIEFDQEVTITNKVEFGGYLPAVGPMTGTTFTFAGGNLIPTGSLILEWQPANATPVLIQWLSGGNPIGAPYFTSVAVLARLLGQGIVAVREANPEVLQAAFAQFFAANAAYLAGLSESLGMSLQDSLMPIIMSAPAEGIENFFNTIVGMLGVTSLEELLQGEVDFGALFALLGL